MSEAICRAPDSDPPVLAAGGIFADMATRRSRVEIDPTRSVLNILSIDGPQALPVSGRLDLLGEPCTDCLASVHMSLSAGAVVAHGVSLDQIHLSAGTGSVPVVPLDSLGNGDVAPGLLDGTLSMRIDGVPNSVTTRNLGFLRLEVNRAARSFSLSGGLSLIRNGVTASGSLELHGRITNQPPTSRIAQPALTAECTSPVGALVHLAAQVDDPDGPEDLLIAQWNRRVEGGEVPVVPWLQADVLAGMGHSSYEFLAMDTGLQTHRSELSVDVVDTTPPRIDGLAYLGPLCLWPPQHKYVVLRASRDISALVHDACDPAPSIVFTSAVSNQPTNGLGDGNTSPDVVSFDDHVCLRSERAGPNMADREYVVGVAAIDSSGNRSDPTIRIIVPHDAAAANRCAGSLGLEFADDGDEICAVRQAQSPAAAGTRPGCQVVGLDCLITGLALVWIRRRKS